MPQYIHTLACKVCNQRYKELRNDEAYFKPTQQCYELARDQLAHGRGCTRWVRWDGWGVNKPLKIEPQPAPTLEGTGTGILRRLLDSGFGPNGGMLAVLYCPTLGQPWIAGRSGSNQQGAIPGAVWAQIPTDFEPAEMCFGRACAEVHALRQLFTQVAGYNVANLGDIRFIAMDRGGNVRGPCRNCTTWLRHYGIRAYFGGRWQVP